MMQVWRACGGKSMKRRLKRRRIHAGRGGLFSPPLWVQSGPMPAVAQVTIHASQFPENVRRDLLESLRTRRVNHKFHYDSVKQTQQWLALHQAYSPSRNDADCAA